MRRHVLAAASILLLFVVLLVARLPATWLHSSFASQLPLANIHGTAWNGSASIVHPAFPVETLRWQLDALPLLSGRLQASLSIDEPGLQLQADVGLSAGYLDLTVNKLDIDAGRLNRLRRLPLGAQLAGDIKATAIRLEKIPSAFREASGQLQWSPAYLVSPQAVSLQAYSASLLQEEGSLLVTVRDHGGPVGVDGLLTIDATLDYRYILNLQLREPASDALRAGFNSMGKIDADGVVSLRGSGHFMAGSKMF